MTRESAMTAQGVADVVMVRLVGLLVVVEAVPAFVYRRRSRDIGRSGQ